MKEVKVKIKKPYILGHEILCDITKYPFTDTYLTLSS